MDSQYKVDSTQQYETSTATSSNTDIGLDQMYLKSIDSILKIAEMVLSLIVFICITSHAWYSVVGGGWVQFVSISCLITVLILWIFFMLRIIYKLPGPWSLIILIYFIVYSVFYLICFLVCAIQAGNYGQNGGLIAAAVLIYFIVYDVLYFITAIVCAAQAGKYHDNGGLIAGAVFSFVTLGVLGVDTFFQFRKFQEGQSRPAGSTGATTGGTTVTSTHTTYETRTQY